MEPHGVAQLWHLISHACCNPGEGLWLNLTLHNGQNIRKLGFAGLDEDPRLLIAGSLTKARLVGRDHIFNSLHSLLIATIRKLLKLCLQRANLSSCLGDLGIPVLLMATWASLFLQDVGWKGLRVFPRLLWLLLALGNGCSIMLLCCLRCPRAHSLAARHRLLLL